MPEDGASVLSSSSSRDGNKVPCLLLMWCCISFDISSAAVDAGKLPVLEALMAPAPVSIAEGVVLSSMRTNLPLKMQLFRRAQYGF